MNKYWRIVNEVIRRSDVVLEVLDARMIDETRNKKIEEKIKEENKKLIHVVNKMDLVDPKDKEGNVKGLSHPVFISATKRLGTTILKNRIMEVGGKDRIMVGVVGYPNTGKSSVINSLAGRHKARTSSEAGFTKGIQHVKASDRVYLLDTPGVFPVEDISKLILIGAKNPQNLKEPDLVAMELIRSLKGRIEEHYGVPVSEDLEETLEAIARKMNKLKKGGIPDIIEASKIIIRDWQRGKM